MFLGPDLIPFLLLALGAALVVGNGLAMIKPRLEPRTENEHASCPSRSQPPNGGDWIDCVDLGSGNAYWLMKLLSG